MEPNGEQQNNLKGAGLLHQKNSNLQQDHFVNLAVEQKLNAGGKVLPKPAERINAWMEVLERTHLAHREDPLVMGRIKRYYHEKYCIKPENVPPSYFENQKRLYRERGFGNVEITEDMRHENIARLIEDQNSSLDKWFDYLTGPYSDFYPMWAKYWIFDGVTKLAGYDKDTHKFKKRDKNTVNPFPDLNQEALAKAVDVITKKIKGDTGSFAHNPHLKNVLGNANFGELYALELHNLETSGLQKEPLSIIEGQWLKYPQGSDHLPLVHSLEGHNTGWCTAGESTARAQLDGGDFYVYYSNDAHGNPTIPRVAIRMSGSNIGEVRGIAKDQNLDPYVNTIVEAKLQEFPDRDEYVKKVANMKQLTDIDNRVHQGQPLSGEDLRFLYEIDAPILSFGHDRDPRIKEILRYRDPKLDVALAMGCSEAEISTSAMEALRGGVKLHYGDLEYHKPLTGELIFPETVKGDLFFEESVSTEHLVLPKKVSGSLCLTECEPHENDLELPKTITGNLLLGGNGEVDRINFPEKLGGSLILYFNKAEGLTLPEEVEHDLDFKQLTDARGLTFPRSVGGSLFLDELVSADGLVLPESIGGNLMLGSLTSIESLVLPENIGGQVYFRDLPPQEFEKLKQRYPNLRLVLDQEYYSDSSLAYEEDY